VRLLSTSEGEDEMARGWQRSLESPTHDLYGDYQ
jgi:hypothetical protein